MRITNEQAEVLYKLLKENEVRLKYGVDTYKVLSEIEAANKPMEFLYCMSCERKTKYREGHPYCDIRTFREVEK